MPDIKVHAFYETTDKPGIKIPDVGAKVFYYYKVCLENNTESEKMAAYFLSLNIWMGVHRSLSKVNITEDK